MSAAHVELAAAMVRDLDDLAKQLRLMISSNASAGVLDVELHAVADDEEEDAEPLYDLYDVAELIDEMAIRWRNQVWLVDFDQRRPA